MSKLVGYVCLLSAVALAGCATYPGDAPIVESGPPAPVGTWAAMGQPVYLAADLVATPMELTEDSRCPQTTQCVWEGRVVVLTRIDGPGWRETVEVETGKSVTVREREIVLSRVAPTKTIDGAIPLESYRFDFRAE